MKLLFSEASVGMKKKRLKFILKNYFGKIFSFSWDANHSLKLVHECIMLVREILLVFVITE